MNEDLEYIQEYIKTKSELAAYNIVQKYRKFVYLTVLQKIKDTDEAKDITQEIFIKVLNSLAKFKMNSSFKTWLYRISVNETFTYLRKKKIRQFFSLSNDDEYSEIPDSGRNPEENYTDSELSDKLLKVMNTLPEKQKAVFAFRYFEGLSYEEIAEITGTSVGALKANYFHAIKKVSTDMKKIMER